MLTPLSKQKLIEAVLERRAKWKRLYSQSYYDRFFPLYAGELDALLDLAEAAQFPLDHLPDAPTSTRTMCSADIGKVAIIDMDKVEQKVLLAHLPEGSH